MDQQKARLNEILADTLKEWEVDCPSETVVQMTEHLLSNGVTIPVRCKDCKFWKPLDDGFSSACEGRTDGNCDMIWKNHQPECGLTEFDHYCRHGEPKI